MKKAILVVLSLFISLILLENVTIAQKEQTFQYAVKIICGESDGRVVAQGIYLTAINLHNPFEKGISFRKKVAIALPGEKPGPLSKFFKGKIGPNQALEIDCQDIIKLIEFRGKFLKGFVIIESQLELDIVAVYTAVGENGKVETLHIERVSPRRLMGCPDLVVDKIDKPIWDGVNGRTVIHASIKNIGSAAASSTLARVIDPTTPQETGAPYNDVAHTPPLAPGGVTTVTFYLPYWVYNPDVTLEVTADYKNELSECNEDNNIKVFKDIG